MRKMFICHRCDNPPCVNPAHLFAGTPADNLGDAAAKGRMPKFYGTHGRRKLTVEQVREIRRINAEGQVKQGAIGKMFGVSIQTVNSIVNYKSWWRV